MLSWGAHAWDGRGTVRVTADAVEFEVPGEPLRRADRGAIAASVLYEKSLWLRRRGAPDLLIKCQRMRDAQLLASALAPTARAPTAAWRKVLAEEIASARRGWFGTRDAGGVLRRIARRDGPWLGRGAVRVTHEHIVFEAVHGRPRTTSRRTVERALVRDRVVWVRRVRAHDWLVRFESAAEARRFQSDLLAAR